MTRNIFATIFVPTLGFLCRAEDPAALQQAGPHFSPAIFLQADLFFKLATQIR